jgi:alkylated DNA repair dioxygenase AlkB
MSRIASQARWLIPEQACYVEAWLERKEADWYLLRLLKDTAWLQPTVKLFGRERPCPRLSAWHGDATAAYSYSGIELAPEPWTPELRELQRRAERSTGTRFNSVLLNLYRSGADSMGWHSDDEPELGKVPVIASISLGGVRRFRLKRRLTAATSEIANAPRESSESTRTVAVDLAHGSLLVMRGYCQRDWKHALPKTKRVVEPRLNLTFRRILADGGR